MFRNFMLFCDMACVMCGFVISIVIDGKKKM